MAAAKSTSKGAVKGKYICAKCDTEFTGSTCPQCGTGAGNIRLAEDGIPHANHTNESIFGNPDELEGYVRSTDDEFLMDVQNAKVARAEFTENLRQSQVMSSEIKKIEKEKKLLEKQRELERFKDGGEDMFTSNEKSSGPGDQFPNQPLFGVQSPQSQFMGQLMKMDGERRAEFMAQLSDADPAALNTLSGMFIQPQGQMAQNPGIPGQFPGMYPPWMMQQQPQQEPQKQESTTAVMKEMFGLIKEMQPARDDTALEVIRELKDEIKGLHSRIDSVGREQPGQNSNDALIQYVQNLEKKIENSQQRPSFSEQAKELKDTIQNLESIGLVNNNTGVSSIEDKIRMKEIDHQIDMETKQFQVDRDSVDVEKQKQQAREQFTKSLFTNILTKDPEADSVPAPVVTVQSDNPFFNMQPPKVLTKPKVIVDTIQSDEGIVREVRDRPVDGAQE